MKGRAGEMDVRFVLLHALEETADTTATLAPPVSCSTGSRANEIVPKRRLPRRTRHLYVKRCGRHVKLCGRRARSPHRLRWLA